MVKLMFYGGAGIAPSVDFTRTMAPYTCLIVLYPEIPFILPEMKGNSGTDGANYRVIKLLTLLELLQSLCKFWYGYLVINYLLIIDISI